jgi:Transposase C of IS166 homeodomain
MLANAVRICDAKFGDFVALRRQRFPLCCNARRPCRIPRPLPPRDHSPRPKDPACSLKNKPSRSCTFAILPESLYISNAARRSLYWPSSRKDAALAAKDAELIAAKNGLIHSQLTIETLKAQLAKLRREKFGQSSERIERVLEQLELALEEAAGQAESTAPAEATSTQLGSDCTPECAGVGAARAETANAATSAAAPRRCSRAVFTSVMSPQVGVYKSDMHTLFQPGSIGDLIGTFDPVDDPISVGTGEEQDELMRRQFMRHIWSCSKSAPSRLENEARSLSVDRPSYRPGPKRPNELRWRCYSGETRRQRRYGK